VKKLVAVLLAILLLTVFVPDVYADSGPPWAQNLDNLSYTEQEGWKALDADVSVSSDTNDFSEGYIEVNIPDGTGADNFQLVSGGSLTVTGDAVYWNGDRIGTIDGDKDGSAGVLRINFSSTVPLTNADFETGDMTGWTADNNYPGVNAQAWVENPGDDPDVPDGNVDSDPLVDDYTSITQTSSVQSATKYEGSYALRLTISGTVAEGYGTFHGPMVTSETFNAAVGDNLSVNWNALQDGDWYDVYGFVINDANDNGVWDDGENYQKLFHDVGSSTGGWITTTASIGAGVAGSNLRFVFLNGNYDASGGRAIGSSLYIDGIELHLSTGGTVVNDSVLAAIIESIEYRNTSDDPPAVRNYTLSFEESDAGTGFNSAQIDITPVNDFPVDIILSNDHVLENQPLDTVVGNLSTTDPDNTVFIYSFTGGDTAAFSINGTQLRTAAVFDYETINSYTVGIQADDGAGGTYSDNFTIFVDDMGDTVNPLVAAVTVPADGGQYNAASMPAAFSGTVGDAVDEEGAGLNADSAGFTLMRGDNKYWDGDSWEAAATWLATTHVATTDNNTAVWTDNITLPVWSEDTYVVQAKATDAAARTFTGAAITFIYDTTAPGVTLDDIPDTILYTLPLISGTAADVLPGQLAGVQVAITDNTTARYWDGNSWEDTLVWLDAVVSDNWTYNTSTVGFINTHFYTAAARAADLAGNISPAVTDNFTFTTPAVVGGGGSGSFVIDLLTADKPILTNPSGAVVYTTTATSSDGSIILTIEAGTIVKEADGHGLNHNIIVKANPDIPAPPDDYNLLSIPYDFTPDGLTFSPAITLTLSYDPAALPEGADETKLSIAYYDESAGAWVILDCTVDTVNHTVTALITHFTTFAVIGPAAALASFSLSNLTVTPAEMAPGATVTITVAVTNTGGSEGSYAASLSVNGVPETTITVTLQTGGIEYISYFVSRQETGSYLISVGGLEGTFTVKAPEVAPPSPTPTTPAPSFTPTPTPSPTVTPLATTALTTTPAAGTGSKWVIPVVIAAAVIVAAGIIIFIRKRHDKAADRVK
jgi:hypothetical protein